MDVATLDPRANPSRLADAVNRLGAVRPRLHQTPVSTKREEFRKVGSEHEFVEEIGCVDDVPGSCGDSGRTTQSWVSASLMVQVGGATTVVAMGRLRQKGQAANVMRSEV